MALVTLSNVINSTSIVLNVNDTAPLMEQLVPLLNSLEVRLFLYENTHALLPVVKTEQQAMELLEYADISMEYVQTLARTD